MAITKSEPKIEMRVIADGKPAVEYTNQQMEDDKNVWKFIEATTGPPFTVSIKYRPNSNLRETV